NDAVVQKADAFVRNNVPRLTATYELSLAILFLDRLGEPRDQGLIRTMALRLVAGQTAAGGWDYHVPLLKPTESDQLFVLLEKTTPRTFRDPLTETSTGAIPLQKSMASPDALMVSKEPNRVGRADPSEPARKAGESQSKSAIEPFHPDGKDAKTDKPANLPD